MYDDREPYRTERFGQEEPIYLPETLQQAGQEPNPSPAPRRKRRRGGRNALLALTMVACLGLGFLGGVVGGRAGGTDAPAASADTGSGSAVQATQTAAGTGTSEQSVSSVAKAAADAVVEITTETRTFGYRQESVTPGAGSGVIISNDGYIVTNNHVIEDADTITVRLRDGTTYDATLVGTDAKTDIAVIKIEASGLTAATYGDSDALEVGDLAVAIGNPLGELGGTVTSGIISALDREISIDGETMNLLQTSAAINPGNSGGGLFNASGELVGVVNAKSSGLEIEGLGFAIPINTAKPVIEQLIANGYVPGRVDLGFSLIDILDTQTAMNYRVQQLGVYVLSLDDESVYQSTGLRPGDLLLTADGQQIESSADFEQIIDEHAVGDTLPLTVQRNGQTLSVQLTLQEQK